MRSLRNAPTGRLAKTLAPVTCALSDQHNSYLVGCLLIVGRLLKIIDYDDEELEENANPFATLMLAAKRAFTVERSDDTTKKLFKVALLRLGIGRGYTSKELEALFYFVDWVVTFSDTKTRDDFVGEVRSMAKKEEVDMPVTSIEEVVKEEVKFGIARRMLNSREPEENILLYTELSPEELAELKEQARQETH